MENRKRGLEQHTGRPHPDTHIPKHILDNITYIRARFVEYIVPELEPGVLERLEAGKLTPDRIYEQLQESSTRGNTPKQLTAVYAFLMNHYYSVVRGEQPLPLDSVYRRVPFSRLK